MADEINQEDNAAVEGLTTTEDEATPGGEQKPRYPKRDEVPVEELYDLSQPIPKVDRPSKEEHEAEVAAINDAIDALKEDRRLLQVKIDSSMDSSKNAQSGKDREVLADLRAKKGALIDEKRSMRARLDATKNETDRLMNDRKASKVTVKYTDLATIDAEIAKLQRKQETTSMSLSEEKRLIKEMNALQASKKHVADLKTKDASIDDVKEQRKNITAEITAKDKEIDAVQAEIDEKSATFKELFEKETDVRDSMQKLFAEREELKQAISEKMDERNKCRNDFREGNNKWFDYQRAVRAQKKFKYEEEKKRREEEQMAWAKKKEESEAKKIPYEEEMALCDYLANYLSRTYLNDGKKGEDDKKQDDVVVVKDDPFAGVKPVNKKSEDVFLRVGKAAKKPRSRPSKQNKKPTALTLNVDHFEQFGLLNLTPPTSLAMVEDSVAELKAKKEWYSEQPRGSVPTAQDIRKANEKAAAKLKDGSSGDAPADIPKASNGSKKGGAFALSNDDFAPLGAGDMSHSSINAAWGQKSTEEEAPVFDQDPTPAEAEK